jgi:hypothetical protein
MYTCNAQHVHANAQVLDHFLAIVISRNFEKAREWRARSECVYPIFANFYRSECGQAVDSAAHYFVSSASVTCQAVREPSNHP